MVFLIRGFVAVGTPVRLGPPGGAERSPCLCCGQAAVVPGRNGCGWARAVGLPAVCARWTCGQGAPGAAPRVLDSDTITPMVRITKVMPRDQAGGNLAQPIASAMKILEPMKISRIDSAYFR